MQDLSDSIAILSCCIFQNKKSVLLLQFEVLNLLRGGLVADVSNQNNLLRGECFLSQIKSISSEENYLFFCFCQPRSASPHSHTHLLQAIVALRPAPAAETCVDPQTVANCVECKIVQIQNTLFQVFVL